MVVSVEAAKEQEELVVNAGKILAEFLGPVGKTYEYVSKEESGSGAVLLFRNGEGETQKVRASYTQGRLGLRLLR